MENDLIMTVTQLTTHIQSTLNRDELLKDVRVRGEISGFKAHYTGHWYFDLKDETGVISCAMWGSNNRRCSLKPDNGMCVIVEGYADVYPKTGRLQLIVQKVSADGVGDLHLRYEQLKARLYAEGLFDRSRKRMLPPFPRKIAVLTSETGAVYHDICKVAAVRNPSVTIALLPVPVQGANAASLISAALQMIGRQSDIDVVIVGRGGGSMEDLWPFNEECVARAIAACPIPVISAVGHETDNTIADLVADERASTPSNAAELAIPDRSELLRHLADLRHMMNRTMDAEMNRYRLSVLRVRNRITTVDPEKRLMDCMKREQLLKQRLQVDTDKQIRLYRMTLEQTKQRLDPAMERYLADKRQKLTELKRHLSALSPQNVLRRGYAMVSTKNGNVITTVADAYHQTVLTLHFADGQLSVIPENGNKGRDRDG